MATFVYMMLLAARQRLQSETLHTVTLTVLADANAHLREGNAGLRFCPSAPLRPFNQDCLSWNRRAHSQLLPSTLHVAALF